MPLLFENSDEVKWLLVDLADEVMITTFLPEAADRRRTIVEMARVFALEEGWSPAAVAEQVAH